MSLRAVFLVLLLLGSLLAVAPTGVAQSVETRSVAIRSWDGTTLAADLYWTEAAVAAPVPAILMTHGWAGSKSDLVAEARWLADLGFVVLAYDSRGFGSSEGTVGLNGPDEWADASHLVSWLARLQEEGGPKVQVDDAAANDPRIGMYGYSYGGAVQLLTAAEDDRIDAIVPDITWSDLRESLAPNTVVKRGWVDLLFWGGLLTSSGAAQGDPDAQGMDARLREWYLEAMQTGRLPPEADAALAERSPVRSLSNITAAVFLTQGLKDTLFIPDEAVANFLPLTSREDSETRLLFHPAGHGHVLRGADRDHVRSEVARFYLRHLQDQDLPATNAVQWYDGHARAWWSVDAWPPEERRWVRAGPVDAGAPVTLVQAAPPSSHTDLQEFEGELGGTAQDAPGPSALRIPLDLEAPVALLGGARLQVNVTPAVDDLTLFFSLVDVGPRAERVVGNQVAPVRVEDRSGQRIQVEVALPTVAHVLQNGHHVELRVATSDSGYMGSREAGTAVLEPVGLVLEVPLLDRDLLLAEAPDEEDPVREGLPAVGLGWLVVASLLMGAARRRRGDV